MSGQQNYLVLSQEEYFDEFEKTLLEQADLLYLKNKFGIGGSLNKDKVRHSQLFYNILCTDECELIDWVRKKINGDLEDIDYIPKVKDFKIYETPFGQNDCQGITDCCNWAENEW